MTTTREAGKMGERASILLVDDRTDKLVALRAVLADLDVDLVAAQSGREALRWVLQREFAAILLDVNMPGMDGFETASLIRKRPRSERTPILFVTAYSEDTHVARGYSLGAVDYIVAPIVPEVLRTKVGVFVDLFNAVRREREHAAALERHAQRLEHLTRAAQEINSGASTDEIVEAAMQAARDIVGGATYLAGVSVGERRLRVRTPRTARPAAFETAAVERLMRAHETTLGAAEVRRVGPAACPDGDAPAPGQAFPVVEGLLASLTGHQGRRLGVLCIADKPNGTPYDREDEALFLQIARMAGIAMENLLFSQEHEANHLKEEFLSTLSHELRTPLTAILGWVRLLQQGRLDAAATERALGVIERNVKVQSKLIDDLLDISRIASGKFRLAIQPVAIHDLLMAAVDAARPMAEAKSLALLLSLGDPAEPVAGDADRLQQVVWNLLTNAIKFTPAGGRIEVRVECRGGSVRISVADTGKGISPEFLPHVFERFRQADGGSTRAHGGLGIGLAVVRHIVELHGGSVRAESAGESRGSTFTVALPTIPPVTMLDALHVDADDAPLAERPARPLAALSGTRILVVDDDQDTQLLLQEILSRQGARVLALGSADEASRAVEGFQPDVLISDLGMPVQDGWALIEGLRRRYSDAALPAIALSAYAGDADRMRSQLAGFAAHLAKPVEPEDLVAVVAQLMAAKEPSAARPEPSADELRARQAVSLGALPSPRGGSS